MGRGRKKKKEKERAVKESLHSEEEAEMALSPEMCPGRAMPADVKTAKTGGDTRDVLGTGQSSK